jgi:dephospho-CoA kinase
MPFIGLTGGLGTGKTTVLRLFKRLGAYTISADQIVHDLLKKETIINRLVDILGEDILVKKSPRPSIIKKRIADIIFDNPSKRKSIERFIHPEVMKTAQKIQKKIYAANKKAFIVFEVPLLFEGGYRKTFDKTVVVYCSKKNALARVMKQGLSKEKAMKIMQAQLPIAEKKARADFVINNNTHLRNTRAQVEVIFNELSVKTRRKKI